MISQSHSWRQWAFLWIAFACVQFVVLTFLAMFFYPGGTTIGLTKSGYSFVHNFFSELGLTESLDGQSNIISAILFAVSMTLAGSGLGVFFLAFPQSFTRSSITQFLSWSRAILGALSGLFFVGVALTSADLFLEVHYICMLFAFIFFLLAVISFILSIIIEKRYPNRLALAFVGFAVLLIGYLVLVTQGPPADLPMGRMTQAVGQKIIGYASVISIFIQTQCVRKLQKQSIARDHVWDLSNRVRLSHIK